MKGIKELWKRKVTPNVSGIHIALQSMSVGAWTMVYPVLDKEYSFFAFLMLLFGVLKLVGIFANHGKLRRISIVLIQYLWTFYTVVLILEMYNGHYTGFGWLLCVGFVFYIYKTSRKEEYD